VTRVAIIGAGPYGLSIASHLRAHDVPFRIFGPPLETWRRHMPAGMSLKSDGFASNLSDPRCEGTLAAYCAEHRIPYHDTAVAVDLDVFNAYAAAFQQRFVPELENRQVVSLERRDGSFVLQLDDGRLVSADHVVCAIGITYFSHIPGELAGLPLDLVTHSYAHHDLSGFAGRDVTVIGGGSSAVDIATLLAEAGAKTSLIARGTTLRFFSEPVPGPRSRWQRLRHPSSGLGPGMRSWLCQNVPGLFRFLPGNARSEIVRRHLGPKSAWAMKARLEAAVDVRLGEAVDAAIEENGRVRLILRTADGDKHDLVTDHVVAATGYYPDVSKIDFINAELRSSIRTHARMAVLSGNFESSVRGLYFVGPSAADSFGPLMRFMVGAEFVAPRVAGHLARRVRRGERLDTTRR
jgi:cation diffusion facilitator CzcD-associated flavoprotein CzcO